MRITFNENAGNGGEKKLTANIEKQEISSS
jgi:hypothetical protein